MRILFCLGWIFNFLDIQFAWTYPARHTIWPELAGVGPALAKVDKICLGSKKKYVWLRKFKNNVCTLGI